MGIVRVTEDAMRRQMYEGIQAHLVPRGVSIPIDLFGLGEIRYGKKASFVLPLYVGDNRFRLEESAIFGTDRITLNREPEWIVAGSYVYINKNELHEVTDVIDEVLVLGSTLLADHVANQPVYHYSNPIKVEGAYSRGVDLINVDTAEYIVRGDVIAISSRPDITLAFKEYTVEDYRLTSDTGGIKQYQVRLDRGIHRDLDDEEIIQIRAYMAYKSRVLNIPTGESFIRQIYGPFLVDWKSVPFLNGVTIDETQYIQKYDSARSPIGAPINTLKNLVVLDLPIKANQFLFWDRVDGNVNYDKGLDRFLALLNDDGEWRMKHTCVPNIEIPFTYAAGSIVTPAKTELFNNEYFRIDDSQKAVRFEYQVNSGYVPTPSAEASGFIQVGAAVASINNNDWFKLNDGLGTEITFEFKVDSATFTPTSGRVVIDISAAVFPVDVAVPMVTAINNVGSLKITASRSTFTVNLQNNEITQRGNQVFELGPNLYTACGWLASDPAGLPAGLPPFEMTGGTDAVETIDIQSTTTAEEVALLTSTAILRSNLLVESELPGIFNSFRLYSTLQGVEGNIPITYSIGSPNFMVTGMSGGSGGIRWNFSVKPLDQDIMVRIRFYPNDWLPEYYLTAGTETTITAELFSTDDPVERIDFLIRGEDGTSSEVQIGDWNNSTPKIAGIYHEYVARVLGDHNFAATGLWIKPILPSLHDVETRLGVDAAFNDGHAHV